MEKATGSPMAIKKKNKKNRMRVSTMEWVSHIFAPSPSYEGLDFS
jgi:hypothetical protein